MYFNGVFILCHNGNHAVVQEHACTVYILLCLAYDLNTHQGAYKPDLACTY